MTLIPKKTRQQVNSLGKQTRSVRWDNHVCLPFGRNRRKKFNELERHKNAGFNIATVNIGYAARSWSEHVSFAEEFTEWILEHDQTYLMVRTAADIQKAIDTKRLGIIFDVEGANLLEGKIERVELLYDLGVRWMCLTYNITNKLAGGCSPNAKDIGLTDFGRKVVREMNRVGMVVCCSHTGPVSAKQVIENSDQPMIFSHSNCNHIFAHWRNIDDDEIRACAEKGGVICVNGVGPFLSEPPYEQLADKALDHIEHLADIVGTEHVGIGLDYVYDQSEFAEILGSQPSLFGGTDSAPTMFDFIAPEDVSDIEDGLLGRGFSKVDIEKIIGGNLVRVGTAVWN